MLRAAWKFDANEGKAKIEQFASWWRRGIRGRRGVLGRDWTNPHCLCDQIDPDAQAAAAFLEADRAYRRIMGYKNLWVPKAHLEEISTLPVEQQDDVA